jgi:D-alanyl-lipoteichoic acid acyltransferase DltB (MBOAT superfamily)
MLFNYIIGNTLAKESKKNKNRFSKKSILVFGIISNIILLAYFKYSDFFIENFNLALGTKIELLQLALPLAISFFTFQQIAYLVDSYRRETQEYDFLNYAVFVTFFPQLIAGPIVHHKEMMPQFADIRSKLINYKNILMGLFIFSIGLFKKVVIADAFAKWATAGFDHAQTLNLIEAWATSLSYTFQLYFDFSGYTDMAIGLALLFNIKLPINFNSPYKALDIQDFWRRWHITLSRFLRDYIYIPLGGNRKGSFRTYTNLLATFMLGGIWHGAGWTFLFWGFLHGIALVFHRGWKIYGFTMPKLLAWFITFNFINIAWVFFRAKEWDDAMKVLSGMSGVSGVVLSEKNEKYLSFIFQYDFVTFGKITQHIGDGSTVLNYLLLALLMSLVFKNSAQLIKYPTMLKINEISFFKLSLFALVLLAALSIMSLQTYTEFIYFNF